MAIRTFDISFDGTITLQIDDSVIDRVDGEWRDQLYNLYTPKDIAEHIAYNIVVNRVRLSNLDGWADMKDDLVNAIDENWEFYATEIKQETGTTNE